MPASAGVPPVRDVVLLGGGHSHVQVLKSWGMRPEPGVRLTLVSRDLESPYSGMLPGCIAGTYSVEDIHIKLAPLCVFADARFIQAAALSVDPQSQQILFADRPPLRYDVLSINTGAVPVSALQEDAVTVKPISEFLPKWQHVLENIQPSQTLAIVGAGAGGVELAMATRARLDAQVNIALVGACLMPGHNSSAQTQIATRLKHLGVSWHEGRVLSADSHELCMQEGPPVAADYVLWVTEVCAPDWIREAGFLCDERGFLSVDQYLRSASHHNVFAAGDVAHLQGQERAKSGVYAVRAGPMLAENLRRAVKEIPLKAYRAQSSHLALIGDGRGYAIASRGSWASTGRHWWWLKDRIDRGFMRKFNELPNMVELTPKLAPALLKDLPEQLMRCGGCGAKLAADPLRRVLARLPKQDSAHVVLGIGDDAAVIASGAGDTLLTVDGFRAMLDDPYLFGRIAAHHSLNDIFAMSAQPQAGLVFATVPLMSEALMAEELFQMLSGVVDVLNAHQVPLVGGHSAEGAELSLGITVMGQPGENTLRKTGAQIGDRLILTKAIGTGVVLAGAMRGQASSAAIEAAQASMDQSNARASEVFNAAHARAMTDVTGFGLVGHLSEMMRASACGARIDLSCVPRLHGVIDMFSAVHSSLQLANELALQDFQLGSKLLFAMPEVRVLADPQTSGGLLASVPAEQAQACLVQLIEAGYNAADIGQVTSPDTWLIT